MPQHVELLSGGLVTAKPPALLEPGELQQCQGAHYRAGSSSLYPAPERSSFGSVGAALDGMVMCRFDSGTHLLVAKDTSGNYLKATVGATGTWSALTSKTSGTSLQAIQYLDKYYLLDGSTNNLTVLNDSSTRRHGLTKVSTPPGISVTTSGGFFPGDVGTAGFYFEYWVTEVYKNGTDEIESDVDGTAGYGTTPSLILNNTYKVTLTPPPVVNSIATHWRFYRSTQGKENAGDKVFPAGVMIGELPISSAGGTSFTDGAQNVGSASAPTTAANTGAPYSNWTNPSNITADDTSYATFSVNSGTYVGGNLVGYAQMYATTFGSFGASLADPINGVEVTLLAGHDSSTKPLILDVFLVSALGKTSNHKTVPLVGSGIASYTIGGPGEMWGVAWTAADFAAGFKIYYTAYQYNLNSATILQLDYTTVKAYYNQTQAESQTFFPAVTLEINGQTSSVGENGEPPVATTGDIFEDCLVLNDTSSSNLIRYSVPARPEAFPSIYFVSFETPDNDAVLCIRTLGNRLMVGMGNQLWRVNYLPNEEDASFNRGRAIDLVDPYFGIVGPQAAVAFVGADGRTELAYVSKQGLRGTDGFTTRTLCDDLDWTAILTPSTNLSKVVLVNDPSNYELILYVPQGDSSYMIKAYRFNYHRGHLKDDGLKLKASGPFAYGTASTVGVRSTCVVPTTAITGYSWVVFVAFTDGTVYRQTLPGTVSGATVENMVVRTRRMYLAGLASEFAVDQIYTLAGAAQSTSQVLTLHKRDATATALTAKTITLVDGLARADFRHRCEAMDLKITGTIAALAAAAYRIDGVVVVGEDFGHEDSK